MTELEYWKSEYLFIRWEEPVPVHTTSGDSGFACRVCIAKNGLKSRDVKLLPKTREEVAQHIEEAHNRELREVVASEG